MAARTISIGTGGGAPSPASTEVFRADYYVSQPLTDFPDSPTITDGVLAWDSLAGAPFPTRVMLDDATVLDPADRGIWIGNEDPLNPGFLDGTFTYAPETEQPYRDGNSGKVGSFGLDVALGIGSLGVVAFSEGAWLFYDKTRYGPNDPADWPDPNPTHVNQALDILGVTTYITTPPAGSGNLTTAVTTVQDLVNEVDALPLGGGLSATLIDGKGELLVGSADDAVDNLPIGTDGHVLTADSAETLGVKWAAPAAGSSSMPALPYRSATYYTLGGGESAASGCMHNSAGRLIAHPVWLPAGTYNRIGVHTTVAAVSTWRLGVYGNNASTMFPDGEALIVDAGTVDMNATAGLLQITTSFTIPTAGIYWLASMADSYTATPTGWGWRGNAGTEPNLPWLGNTAYGTVAFGRGDWGRAKTGVATGSLPVTFPASSVGIDSPVPQILVRAT